MGKRKGSAKLKKYKIKTNKAAKKRFKITATGKVLYHSPGRRHLMSAKNAKKRRQARKVRQLTGPDVKDIKMLLQGQPGI